MVSLTTTEKMSAGTCKAAVKGSSDTTNVLGHKSKWHRDVKVAPDAVSAKQVTLTNIGVRAVSHRNLAPQWPGSGYRQRHHRLHHQGPQTAKHR